MVIKVLKEDSEYFKKMEGLNQYLEENDIEIHATVYNGLIYKTGEKFYKYDCNNGEYTGSIPPYIEGRYILCDKNGNTDFYN